MHPFLPATHKSLALYDRLIMGLGTAGGQAQDEDTVNALKQADLSECTSNM
jgi:hypothetical protein